MEKKIGILLVDDHLLVRQAFRKLLEEDTVFEILGEASDGFEAVSKVNELKPDITLLDINMPKMNGIEALTSIKSKEPNQKVIMLSIHNTRDYIDEVLSLGADGYITKNADIHLLKDAIISVYDGKKYLQPTIINEFTSDEVEQDLFKRARVSHNNEFSEHIKKLLTMREIDILKEVTDGKSNKEIGLILDISEKTVRNHLSSIFKKLDVSDRTQAAVLALEGNIKKLE